MIHDSSQNDPHLYKRLFLHAPQVKPYSSFEMYNS